MEEKIVIDKQETGEISLGEIIQKLREWYRYLLPKWLIIIAFGILGGVLGFTYARFSKPIYVATTTFVLEESEKGGGLGQYAGLASMAGIDLGGGGGGIFQGDNILELYKSRTMIQKTLLTEVNYNGKKELLVDRYIDFKKLREKWAKTPALNGIQFRLPDTGNPRTGFSRLQDSVLGTIVEEITKSALNVNKPDKKLSIIKAVVREEDEFFAKAFNEQIVKKVNDFYVQTKTKKSLENVAILQQKTDSVRMVMNGSIYTAAAITDATPNLNPTRQLQRTAPVQRSQFSVESNKAILTELVKNLELSKISSRKEAPLIQVVDEPILPLYKDQLGKTKAIILGGIIAVFLLIAFYTLKLIFKII